MEFIYRISTFLQTSTKFKDQALVILKIARPFFLKASALHYVLNEKEQEFVWSYFCLEKNYSRNACWESTGSIPSKNDQYLIKIINYLNDFQDREVILSGSDYLKVEDLLARLRHYKTLSKPKISCVKIREKQPA